jgi:hypothetical protein
MSASVLEREMFSEAEATRLLRVPQRTLNYWLEGGEIRGRTCRPVIRTAPRGGHAAVTWAEFIEAGLLREYRQAHRIPMAELRAFIDQVRSQFGCLTRSRASVPSQAGRSCCLWRRTAISTEIPWEHDQSGEITAELAEEYGLSDEGVR